MAECMDICNQIHQDLAAEWSIMHSTYFIFPNNVYFMIFVLDSIFVSFSGL